MESPPPEVFHNKYEKEHSRAICSWSPREYGGWEYAGKPLLGYLLAFICVITYTFRWWFYYLQELFLQLPLFLHLEFFSLLLSPRVWNWSNRTNIMILICQCYWFRYLWGNNSSVSVAAAVRVISMEEDGRLGNLLMEMATLLLLGKHANVTVSLLPQVDPYWHSISAFFFYETDLWNRKMAPRRCSYASGSSHIKKKR